MRRRSGGAGEGNAGGGGTGKGTTEGRVGGHVWVCVCVCRVGVAAEVISLGVWLDHIPLPVFSCCGWGWLEEREGMEGLRKK